MSKRNRFKLRTRPARTAHDDPGYAEIEHNSKQDLENALLHDLRARVPVVVDAEDRAKMRRMMGPLAFDKMMLSTIRNAQRRAHAT